MRTFVEALIEIYTNSPLGFGVADICSVDFPQSTNLAAAFYIVMALARARGGINVVHNVIIVLPPINFSTSITEGAIKLAIVEIGQKHFGRPLTSEEQTDIDNHLAFVSPEDLTVAGALLALEAAGNKDAAIVLHSAAYRWDSLQANSSHDISPVLAEDQWVPHLVNLAKEVTAYSKRSGCYVLLDIGAQPPYRTKNTEALKSVTDCGLFTLLHENDGSQVLAAHIDEWAEEAKGGRVGTVFRAIDNLDWMDSQKSFLKLQILDSVAPGPQTIAMVREEIRSHEHLDASVRIKLARIARRGGEPVLAYSLLEPAVVELNAQEELEVALETAVGHEDGLREKIAERLGGLYPKSVRLLEYRLMVCIDNRQYVAVQHLLDASDLAIDSELESFYRPISTALGREAAPQYEQLLDTISKVCPAREDWARTLCSREALARRDFAKALSLCMPTAQRPLCSGTAKMLLHVTLQILLERGEGGALAISGDQLTMPVVAVIDYLAVNPTDARTRIRLVDLLSVETVGILGLAVAVSVVINRAEGSSSPTHVERIKPEGSLSAINLTDFLKSAFEWMKGEGPIVLQLASFPETLLPASPDVVFDNLRQLVHYDHDLRDGASANAFEQLVFIGVLLAKLTTEPNDDLDLIRYAAARFIMANRPQKARDLAEQVLALAGTDRVRKRLCWLAFADIYHRGHNTIESLIALACMFSVEAEMSVGDILQEAFLLIRVLRDLKFITEAKSVLSSLRTSLSSTGLAIHYERRLVTMELGIEVASLRFDEEDAAARLLSLTKKIETHCSELLVEGEEMSPGLSLLAHCVYLAKLKGYPTSDDALSIIERGLPQATPPFSDLLEAVSTPTPDGRQLIALLKSLEGARYHQDTAFDLTHIAIAARRLLDTNLTSENAEAAIVAVEALSDHAILQSSIGEYEATFASPRLNLDRAFEIAHLGYDVIFMGLSASGRLVRIEITGNGIAEVHVESSSIFSGQVLEEWSADYPYQYAYSKNPNVFWTTTDSLLVTFRPTKPTILVMDTSLQQMPPNLFRVGEDFFGQLIPTCSVPSMSWLTSKRGQSRSSNGKKRAWIPAEPGADNDATLDQLADRLESPLTENGVLLLRTPNIPDDISNCELVLIAAHGGLLPGEQYFQKITDNASLAIYPEALAQAVKGSDVVVLFVCSAGRVDSHPQAETTVGLVKQLFEQGCSTVVASPWPLDVKVPPNWTPTFLRRWSEGATVLEAVYDSNREIARIFGGELVDCLAMNVFGDPLCRNNGNNE